MQQMTLKIGRKLQTLLENIKITFQKILQNQNFRLLKSIYNRVRAFLLRLLQKQSLPTSISKNRFKIIIDIIKYLPLLLALITFVSIFWTEFNSSFILFSILFYPSITFILAFLLLSRLLNFCFAHRAPLYYLLLLRIIDILFLYGVIPITLITSWCLIISLIFILILIIAHIWQR